MLNFSKQKKEFESELNTELSMRKKVWKRIQGQEHKFLDYKHQRRYDLLRLLLKVVSEMTIGELETIVKRIQRKKVLARNQKTLFDNQ